MKTIKKTNFRVVVEPRRLGDYGSIKMSDSLLHKPEEIEKEYQQRCEEIEDQIKRHVDNVGYITIEFDKEERCSFCDWPWEVSGNDSDPDFPKGMPACCEKAQQEWEKENEG